MLANCNNYLYLIMQWECAPLKQFITDSKFHNVTRFIGLNYCKYVYDLCMDLKFMHFGNAVWSKQIQDQIQRWMSRSEVLYYLVLTPGQ